MKNKEIWKPINGYEGRYEVSNFGRVRSLDRIIVDSIGRKRNIKGKIIKQCVSNNEYYYVVLYNNNVDGKTIAVHRLIADAFIDNPNNLSTINHKDENRKNNDIDNLEWCTQQYNVEYSKAKHYVLKNPQGEKIEVFNLRKFCRENNFSGSMFDMVIGKKSSYKGWSLWEEIDEE